MSDPTTTTPKKLTAKQRAWLEHYLACWNATEAARQAGYRDPEVSGWENKQKPEIQALMRARLDELTASADEVLARITDHARGSLAPFLRLTGQGDVVGFDLSEDKPLHLLKRVTRAERTLKDGSTEVTIAIEAYDAQAALIQLGKHHRLFVDRAEVTGPDGGPIQVEDAREQLAARLARRLAAGDAGADPGGDRGPGRGDGPGAPL